MTELEAYETFLALQRLSIYEYLNALLSTSVLICFKIFVIKIEEPKCFINVFTPYQFAHNILLDTYAEKVSPYNDLSYELHKMKRIRCRTVAIFYIREKKIQKFK